VLASDHCFGGRSLLSCQTSRRLRLPPTSVQKVSGLIKILSTAIENLIGSSRRICRNVTRWRAGDMISRWAAVGLLQAEQHFRRVRGYRYLSLLKRALRGNSSKLDATEKAA
jgi:hypothetical protein